MTPAPPGSEPLYRELVENSPHGIMIAQDERGVYANHAIARMGGWTRDRMLGMEMREIFGLLHPEDRARLERVRAEFGDEGPDISDELRIATLDGRRLWLAADSRRVMFGGKPARQLICRDVTELKLTEEALTRRLQLEELVARASTRFIDLDPAQIGAEIERTLREVAELAAADHAYVFSIGADGETLGCTHEHARDGQAPHRGDLQGLSLARLAQLATRL